MRLIRTLSLSLCVIVAIGILLLTFDFNGYQYDKFYPYRLTLESPRTNYLVGDKIQLTAKVVSDYPAIIRVYKERTKSFSLYIRAAIDTKPNFTDSDFGNPLPEATAKDAIEVIWIGPGKPFQLELLGQVIQTKPKGILFDFGKFGTFKKSGLGNFLVWGYWRPISPEPLIDSLEDFSNSIVLNIALPN